MTAVLVLAGLAAWRAYGIDGRVVAGALSAWVLAGWLIAPSIVYEHLGFLDRHVFHDYTKAMSRYRKAVNTHKATVDGICALASLCYAEGDDGEAAALLEEAAKRRPEDPYIKVLLARALTRLGRYDEAVAVTTELQGAVGRDLHPMADVALADALKGKGDITAAASAYQRAAEAAPGLPAPRVGLAEVYLSMGKADAAQVEAHRALMRSPSNSDALYWAGKAVEARGYPATAGKFYRSALESRAVDDRSFSVAYRDVVKAVSAAPEGKPQSLGKDVR